MEPLESRNLLASVSGLVVYDFLADGVETDAQRRVDTPDFELRDLRVYVDADGSGNYTNGEPHAFTDDFGKYEIAGLNAGTHAVGLELNAGWEQTFPLGGADHSVTVGAADEATEVDFGARRPTFVPFTPGNLLVTRASFVLVDLLLEYEPDGELVQAFRIPGSEGFRRVLAKDLVLDSQGRVQIFNGYDDVDLMTFDPATPGFFETSLLDWDMGTTSTAWGDMAAWDEYVFANEHVQNSGAADGVIRFNVSDLSYERFSSGFGQPYSTTIGRDGLLYTMESTLSDATIRVHDPETMQPVRSFQIQERLSDIVVGPHGDIYALNSTGLRHYDPDGNPVKATIDVGDLPVDVYLSGNDTLWMASLHGVQTINTDFDPASIHSFDIPGDVGRSVLGFVTVVEPPLAPQPPTDIDLSNAEVLENQPVGTVVGTLTTTDPDADDTHVYSLVAGLGDTHNASFTIDGDQLKTAEVFHQDVQSQHSIRVQTTDPRGLSYEESLTITVLPGTFIVTHLEPTPSGFTVRFNRPFDLTVMNLYDVEANLFGPADATLVGDATGAVAGSLVLGTDWVTFVATDGPLPADAYTVTLRSADNGFRDPATGDLLDGHRNGTAGDDYVGAFTVDAVHDVIVSLPNFVRGPEQPVDVPATGEDLPVSVSDVEGITSMDVTIEFDPALLSVTGAVQGPGMPTGASATFNVSTPGKIAISFTSPTPLPPGTAKLIILTADVPESANYGASHALHFSAVDINSGAISATPNDAVHVAAYFGDTTGNGEYSGLDAQRVARVAVNLDGGFGAFLAIDPILLGDITGNDELSGLDAQRVGRATVGLDTPEIPSLPEPIRATIGSQPTRLIGGSESPADETFPIHVAAAGHDRPIDAVRWGHVEPVLLTISNGLTELRTGPAADRLKRLVRELSHTLVRGYEDLPLHDDTPSRRILRVWEQHMEPFGTPQDQASSIDGEFTPQVVDEVLALLG